MTPPFPRHLSPLSVLTSMAVGWSFALLSKAEEPDWEAARAFWSFQPPQIQTPPAQEEDDRWSRTPIDRFVLAGIETRGWNPAATADPATLLRRASYRLTGLPPSENDAEALPTNRHPNAHERQVDRLLASYRFGERMASFWMTIARYAEDQAHQVGSDTKYFYPNAHLYRQWVIDAFNRDLPYDKFIRFQLAADFDPTSKEEELEALGFLGLGPKYYNRGRLEVKADEWEDRVDTVTRSFLALTVACARCHDHKYDPITAEDYHALAGVFASTEMHNLPVPSLVEKEKRSEEKETAGNGNDDENKKKKKDPSPEACLHVVKEGEIQNLPVFIRGNVERKGDEVPRRFLTILAGPEPKPFTDGSGRRELAEAIAGPRNPLTWRVMANRLWSIVFDEPLVGTPSNFGKLGMRPTHPALLDYLAVRFREDRSPKKLMREMLNSAAFRQSSKASEEQRQADPQNTSLSRMHRSRLSIEMWRDTLLLLAGNLDPSGGPSMELDDPDNHRRTVYARISRLELNELLAVFDYPDPNIHAARRAETTTTTQKLIALNHPLILSQAQSLASRIMAWEGEPEARLDRLYRMLFTRSPTPLEKSRLLDFLESPDNEPDARRWEQLLQVLFCSNQLLFID